MPRFVAFLLFLAALARPAAGHPPVSLVIDARGVVYFSDLVQVWMLLPDGTLRVAVPNVHTHELWIDEHGALHGEDVTNTGDDYRHRVWKRLPDGTVQDVIPWRDGHPSAVNDYAFHRDAAGRHYVLLHGARRVDVRDSDGIVRSIALPASATPHWLTVRPDGTAFVGAGDGVYRIAPGADAAVRLAGALIERTDAFDFVRDHHALMGLWPGTDGGVYVAVFAGQVVKHVAPDGAVSEVYRSEGAWSPVGGAIAPDGALWLLEFSSSNEARVRRIGPDGTDAVMGDR